MRSKTFAMLALLGAGTLFGATDKQIFDATVKHVDFGGTYLYYQNISSFIPKIAELPKCVYDLAILSGAEKKDALLAEGAAAVAIKVFNPQIVKASAMSSTAVAPQCHVLKQFICFDTKAPGFPDFMAKTNRATAWQQLPADTKFALRGEIHLGTLYARVVEELKKQQDPQLQQLPAQLDALKAQGIDIGMILNSLEGETEILLCGSDLDNPKIKVIIPDKNGQLSLILKAFLPPQQPDGNTAMLPVPLSNGKMPMLIYGQNALTLVSDPALLRPVVGKATLGSLPQFAAYAKHVPAQICSYAIINFDKPLIQSCKAFAANFKEARQVTDMLHPFSLIAVNCRLDDGIASTIVSDFSIPELMVVLPYKISLATMLPALKQAQGKAQQVQCTSNIKQLNLGLAMYACDHNETFPATLDVLKTEKYQTDAKIFACPQGKKPYIYLGAGVELKKMRTPSRYPVIFDAPGCGHKEVNVGMADGHVMSIKVANYKNPAQVIGVLNKKFHYSPEMLNELLAKVAKVK